MGEGGCVSSNCDWAVRVNASNAIRPVAQQREQVEKEAGRERETGGEVPGQPEDTVAQRTQKRDDTHIQHTHTQRRGRITS